MKIYIITTLVGFALTIIGALLKINQSELNSNSILILGMILESFGLIMIVYQLVTKYKIVEK